MKKTGKCSNTYWVFGSFSIYLDIYYIGTYSVQRHIHIKYIALKKKHEKFKENRTSPKTKVPKPA